MKKAVPGLAALLMVMILAVPLAANAQGAGPSQVASGPPITVVYGDDGVTVDDNATYDGILAWVRWWLDDETTPPPTIGSEPTVTTQNPGEPPSTAVTSAPPTTEPPTTEPPMTGPPTTSPPTTGPTATSKPPIGSGEVAYFENFADGDPMTGLDVGIYHRDDFVNADNTSWPGDHASTGPDDLCGPPEDKRTVSRGNRSEGFNTEWVYRCVPGGNTDLAHLMTSIGDTSGYSIGAFTPRQTFTDVREIRWDVNITEMGNRQFPEVKIIPASSFDFQDLPCSIEWLPCETSTHGQLGSVGVSFQNHELSIHNGTNNVSLSSRWGDAFLNPDDPAVDSIRTRRTHFFRDNGNGTLSFGIEQADGTFLTVSRAGRFPTGAVRVVFADHNYTPLKAENGTPTTFTWHWDDLAVMTD